MKWIIYMLKFFRLLPAFTANDVLNAETEDALREHASVVREVAAKAEQRKAGNQRLRAALSEAKSNAAIGGFEHAIRSRDRQTSVRRSD